MLLSLDLVLTELVQRRFSDVGLQILVRVVLSSELHLFYPFLVMEP